MNFNARSRSSILSTSDMFGIQDETITDTCSRKNYALILEAIKYFHNGIGTLSTLINFAQPTQKPNLIKWKNKFVSVAEPYTQLKNTKNFQPLRSIPDSTVENFNNLNHFLWYMIVQLEHHGKLYAPFTSFDCDFAAGLEDFIDQLSLASSFEEYIDILMLAHENQKMAELSVQKMNDNGLTTETYAKKLNLDASKFQQNQPQPKPGIMVYGCCFSKQK